MAMHRVQRSPHLTALTLLILMAPVVRAGEMAVRRESRREINKNKASS
jgi:hypothetical protein